MISDPRIGQSGSETVFEKRFYTVYRAGLSLVLASIVGFLLYVIVGAVGQGSGVFQLPYPFLSFEQDPFLLVFTGVTGVLMSLSLGALGVLSLLSGGNDNRTLIIVLLSSVGIGFGGSATYYALVGLIALFGS